MKNAQPTEAELSAHESRQHSTDTSLAAQRQRLLAALRKSSVTTLDARDDLGIMHPAARVQELREDGHDIHTELETVASGDGIHHTRVARYFLIREATR